MSSDVADSQASLILGNIRGTQLDVNIVLREQRCAIGDLLKLSPGSVLTFDGHASSHAYLTINGQRLANGKVVQSGENYALQIQELLASE